MAGTFSDVGGQTWVGGGGQQTAGGSAANGDKHRTSTDSDGSDYDDDDDDGSGGLVLKGRQGALPKQLLLALRPTTADPVSAAAAGNGRASPDVAAATVPIGPFSQHVYELPAHVLALAVLRYIYCRFEATVEVVEAQVDGNVSDLALSPCRRCVAKAHAVRRGVGVTTNWRR